MKQADKPKLTWCRCIDGAPSSVDLHMHIILSHPMVRLGSYPLFHKVPGIDGVDYRQQETMSDNLRIRSAAKRMKEFVKYFNVQHYVLHIWSK
jgi:hypothetical protein